MAEFLAQDNIKKQLSTEELKSLITIRKMSESRAKCLKQLIDHELQTQSKLLIIIQNNCNHKWTDVGSFTIDNNSREYECKVCGISKE